MSQELIGRLKSDARFIERNRTRSPDQTIAKDILGAIEALASQDKRIAELEQECQLSMATIAEERARAEAAEEAENEAKDCFWAVYPAYLEKHGHGISVEAARTEIVDRAIKAEHALSLAESRGRQIGRGEAWEGFESAPADGTKFDVWYTQSGVEPPRRIIDVYWSEIQDWWCVDGIYGPEEPTPLAMAPLPAYWSPTSMPAAIRNLPTNAEPDHA